MDCKPEHSSNLHEFRNTPEEKNHTVTLGVDTLELKLEHMFLYLVVPAWQTGCVTPMKHCHHREVRTFLEILFSCLRGIFISLLYALPLHFLAVTRDIYINDTCVRPTIPVV